MYSYSVVAIRQNGASGEEKRPLTFRRGAGVSTVNLSVLSCYVQFDNRELNLSLSNRKKGVANASYGFVSSYSLI